VPVAVPVLFAPLAPDPEPEAPEAALAPVPEAPAVSVPVAPAEASVPVAEAPLAVFDASNAADN
jgi:hypothetical protein